MESDNSLYMILSFFFLIEVKTINVNNKNNKYVLFEFWYNFNPLNLA